MTCQLKPCPLCETPYEEGEEACSKCFSPLPAAPADRRDSRVLRRQQTSRLVFAATLCIYFGVHFATRLFPQPGLFEHGLTRGRGDLILALPWLVFLFAGFATYGLPGRTFHHYPAPALIRRGRPRWWKGLTAAATFITAMVFVQELIIKPVLAGRGVHSSSYTQEEIAAAIDTASVASYVGVTVVLAWNALVPLLGHQNLQPVQRRRLMEAQGTRARASEHWEA